MTNTVTPVAMTVADACRYAAIGRTRLYELFATGALHPRRCGGRTVVLTEELRAFVSNLPPAAIRVRKSAQDAA